MFYLTGYIKQKFKIVTRHLIKLIQAHHKVAFCLHFCLHCAQYNNWKVVKYVDVTVIIGLIEHGVISNYEQQIYYVVSWCGEHNLFINVTKTKELIFLF